MSNAVAIPYSAFSSGWLRSASRVTRSAGADPAPAPAALRDRVPEQRRVVDRVRADPGGAGGMSRSGAPRAMPTSFRLPNALKILYTTRDAPDALQPYQNALKATETVE